jgi:hypothetical protein
MSHLVLYPKNSQYVEVTGLKDQSVVPNTYVNTGAMTGTMKDKADADVTGFIDVAGEYQTGSDGVWRFPVDPLTFDPDPGSDYKLFLDGESDDRYFHAERPAKVAVRKMGTEE